MSQQVMSLRKMVTNLLNFDQLEEGNDPESDHLQNNVLPTHVYAHRCCWLHVKHQCKTSQYELHLRAVGGQNPDEELRIRSSTAL